jgi:hypothetical protein
MAITTSKKFNVHVAKQFKEGFDESDPTQMYLFYSRIDPWSSESSPPSLEDTVFSDRDVWRGMTAVKKISNNNVTMSVNKYLWATNTVYTEYDDTNENLATSNFYVITSNNEVYKCLFNANSVPSTVVPTGQSTSVITTGDGYKWKFMYDISQADMNRFGGVNHIPVKTLTSNDGSAQWAVQQAAANGSVPIYEVTSGGSGYLENKGTVTGVTSTTQLTIANTGSGTDSVYNGSTVFISSGLGAGQLRIISGYNATTKLLTVNSAFAVSPNTSSTYHIGPRINIVGDGNGAEAYANVQNGAITRITSVNDGTSYSRARVLITANPSYGSGATAVAYLPDVGGHGSDPENELFAQNVTLNVEVDGSESGFFAANNQFRIYGLLKDPKIRSTGGVASDDRYAQSLRLTVNSLSGTLTQDEFVSGDTSGAKGRVIYFANTNLAGTAGVIHLTYPSGSFSSSENLTANTSGVTAVLQSVQQPDLVPFSGRMLYKVTQAPIERDVDQTENFTITVKF